MMRGQKCEGMLAISGADDAERKKKGKKKKREEIVLLKRNGRLQTSAPSP